ncbi:oligosaccharidyl-lipid flippase family [Strigomonas culicis]|uniref:Protein RFT1 homolog n=1 Tax=Strigomonas culicis TaxID=28005 RepID=S9VDZ2_9TRYP|nr:oligosaccharidyl-lipid flippase family [Strigomonas culicis]|eukprot:EPY21300.1 oligosaccharidyl-lipid flippase family [Strigomonas culicis]
MSDFKHQLLLAMGLNLGLKVVTFSLTVKQTRLLLPEQSGIAFTYMVYTDAVMFLAREAVRNVASRLPLTAPRAAPDGEPPGAAEAPYDAQAVSRVVQFASLAIPIACLVMALFELVYALFGLHQLPSLSRTAAESYQRLVGAANSTASSHASVFFQFSEVQYVAEPTPRARLLFHVPELLVVLSIVLNALAEPCMVVVLSLDLFRSVVLSEFWELFARLTTVIGLLTLLGGAFRSEWEARLAFALGQLAYGGTHLLYFAVIGSAHSRLARWAGGGARLAAVRAAAVGRGGWLPFPWCCCSPAGTAGVLRAQAALFTSFAQESLLRLVLTEGESFALTAAGSRAARGNYQVVSQLGSLVARLVFRVWENACSARWGRDLAAGRAAEAVALLQLMLRVGFYFGFSFVLLGPPLARWFLTVLYTSRWSSPAMVGALQLYCYAIAVMSWNGLLEAFLRAAASPAMVRRLQRRMLFLSGLYVGVCYVALGRWADEAVRALIVLNVGNMVCRIGSALHLALRCTAADGTPILALSDVTRVVDLRMALCLALLLALSRAVAATAPAMLAVGALYAAVVLAGDRTMRELTGSVVRRLPPARRWRLWQTPGGAPPAARPSVTL